MKLNKIWLFSILLVPVIVIASIFDFGVDKTRTNVPYYETETLSILVTDSVVEALDSLTTVLEELPKPIFTQYGIASWYGPGFQGRKTANGERFNTHDFTAAHKKLPFNTMVKVTNLNNNDTVTVRINDRGPFVRGRIIDLSYAAKTSINMGGVARVKIEVFPEKEK